MNREQRRRTAKKIKTVDTFQCTECGNEFVLFEFKDGSSNFDCTMPVEKMCMTCYNKFLELRKLRGF